jgi:hypothetical protein
MLACRRRIRFDIIVITLAPRSDASEKVGAGGMSLGLLAACAC